MFPSQIFTKYGNSEYNIFLAPKKARKKRKRSDTNNDILPYFTKKKNNKKYETKRNFTTFDEDDEYAKIAKKFKPYCSNTKKNNKKTVNRQKNKNNRNEIEFPSKNSYIYTLDPNDGGGGNLKRDHFKSFSNNINRNIKTKPQQKSKNFVEKNAHKTFESNAKTCVDNPLVFDTDSPFLMKLLYPFSETILKNFIRNIFATDAIRFQDKSRRSYIEMSALPNTEFVEQSKILEFCNCTLSQKYYKESKDTADKERNFSKKDECKEHAIDTSSLKEKRKKHAKYCKSNKKSSRSRERSSPSLKEVKKRYHDEHGKKIDCNFNTKKKRSKKQKKRNCTNSDYRKKLSQKGSDCDLESDKSSENESTEKSNQRCGKTIKMKFAENTERKHQRLIDCFDHYPQSPKSYEKTKNTSKEDNQSKFHKNQNKNLKIRDTFESFHTDRNTSNAEQIYEKKFNDKGKFALITQNTEKRVDRDFEKKLPSSSAIVRQSQTSVQPKIILNHSSNNTQYSSGTNSKFLNSGVIEQSNYFNDISSSSLLRSTTKYCKNAEDSESDINSDYIQTHSGFITKESQTECKFSSLHSSGDNINWHHNRGGRKMVGGNKLFTRKNDSTDDYQDRCQIKDFALLNQLKTDIAARAKEKIKAIRMMDHISENANIDFCDHEGYKQRFRNSLNEFLAANNLNGLKNFECNLKSTTTTTTTQPQPQPLSEFSKNPTLINNNKELRTPDMKTTNKICEDNSNSSKLSTKTNKYEPRFNESSMEGGSGGVPSKVWLMNEVANAVASTNYLYQKNSSAVSKAMPPSVCTNNFDIKKNQYNAPSYSILKSDKSPGFSSQYFHPVPSEINDKTSIDTYSMGSIHKPLTSDIATLSNCEVIDSKVSKISTIINETDGIIVRRRDRQSKCNLNRYMSSESNRFSYSRSSSSSRSRSRCTSTSCSTESSSSSKTNSSNECQRSISRSLSRNSSRSSSIPRRRGSPSFLDRRRITSARKRPIPYHWKSPLTS